LIGLEQDGHPMLDKKRAQKKLRNFVESDSYIIAKKAAMMVDHFHEQVIAKGKVGGQARAMVVTASIPRCIEYYYAINKCLSERHSPYKTIIAFSGECKYNGQEPPLTSASTNGFPDAKIPKTFKADPYRILIVADMFQTGFDEPLLHTMKDADIILQPPYCIRHQGDCPDLPAFSKQLCSRCPVKPQVAEPDAEGLLYPGPRIIQHDHFGDVYRDCPLRKNSFILRPTYRVFLKDW